MGVNGFLEEFAQGTSGVSKMLVGMTQAGSDTVAAFIQGKTAVNELLTMTEQTGKGVGFTDLLSKNEDGKGKISETWGDAKDAFSTAQGAAEGGGPLSKVKGFAKGLGGAAKVLSRFAPFVSQFYTGFTLANKATALFTENNESLTDMMSSGATRAAKRLEELATVTEEVTGSLDKLDAAEKNQEKIKRA